jgi:hypothetical protein
MAAIIVLIGVTLSSDGEPEQVVAFASTLLASWRRGVPGKPDDWQVKPLGFLEGDVMLVVTTVEPGAEFTLEVMEISDEPDCGEEEEDTTPTTLGDCGDCSPSQYYHQVTEATSEG